MTWLAVLGVFWLVPGAAFCATAVEVRQAVAKAKQYLYANQSGDRWEWPADEKKQETGLTALCTYALLASGDNEQDARVQAAVKFLQANPAQGVYALGLRCQVWLLLKPTPAVKAAMQKDARLLLEMVKKEGNARGMYDYTNSKGKDYSHSRSQYGVLGLWAAEQAGMEVPTGYWRLVESGWLNNQDPSGGWSYQHPKESKLQVTPGMTAAGIATLYITQDYLHGDEGLNCRGNPRNAAIDAGLKWIAANFAKVASGQPYDRDFIYITLYAMERIGVASGLKYFGQIDWYQKGADWLVKTQLPTGAWQNKGTYASVTAMNKGVADVAFAMLFLSRGGAPVVMNKLEYSQEPAKDKQAEPGNWNQRPRDVANVVRWMSRQYERDLNWQVVNLSVPVDQLHDAPILYVAGNQNLSLTDADEAKLKQFVQDGGMILGNADCASAGFSLSFRKLATKLFPDYEFRELPVDHVLYTDGQYPRSKWRSKPSVLSLSNGVRELIMLIPQADPARAWQGRNDKGKEELYQLMSNIFLYVADAANLRDKGDSHVVRTDPKITTTASMKVARLQYAGNWNPEPAGWARLSAVMHNSRKVDLAVEDIKLGAGKLDTHFAVAHLTGTTGWKLSDAEKNELKAYCAAGGLLFIDAAGGATEFSADIEPNLSAVWPDAGKAEILSPEHPLFSITEPAVIEYRSFVRRSLGNIRTPRLRALKQGDKIVAIVSTEDISGGLVGQHVEGVLGYSPASATSLAMHVLQFASSRQSGAPASKPAPDVKAKK